MSLVKLMIPPCPSNRTYIKILSLICQLLTLLMLSQIMIHRSSISHKQRDFHLDHFCAKISFSSIQRALARFKKKEIKKKIQLNKFYPKNLQRSHKTWEQMGRLKENLFANYCSSKVAMKWILSSTYDQRKLL